MFFKRGGRALLALQFITVTVGCGIHLGKKANEKSAVTYSGKGYACIGEISSHIERYIGDQLSEGEINDFVRCLQRSFTSFAALTRGRDQATYSPDEIRRFLEGYFLKERISDSLLHQFMILKQILVGGRVDRISRPELALAVEILEDIRVEALNLKPHLRYLNPRLVQQQDPSDLGSYLNDANFALKKSIRVFSERLIKSKTVYSLSDMQIFMAEFRKFVDWEGHFKHAHSVQQWIDLLKSFKTITVSTASPEEIQPKEWAPLLESMSNWYFSYLQYQVGIKNQPLMQGVGLDNSLYLAQEVFALFDQALNRRPDKTISFANLDGLFQALEALNWLPGRVRATSLSSAFRALITRVFGNENKAPKERFTSGLTLMNVANMRTAFYQWAYVQLNLSAYQNSNSIITAATRTPVPNLQVPTANPGLVFAPMDIMQDSDFADFLKLERDQLIRPLFPEGSSQIYLAQKSVLSPKVTYSFYDLSMMNALRSIVALLFRGYAADNNGLWRWQAGLKSDELQTFYEDMWSLGIDLSLLDSRVHNAGSRAFFEGKMFTYSAQGVDSSAPDSSELRSAEAMEYLAFLYSGGQTANELFKKLSSSCPHQPGGDSTIPKLDRACVVANLPRLIDLNFTNMPLLQEYLRRSTPQRRQEYAQVIMDTANTQYSDPNWVERDEVNVAAVVLYYAEAVMTRYDTNRDGLLTNSPDQNEVEEAIPKFIGYVKHLAKEEYKVDLNDHQARNVFTYILAYKSLPENDWENEFYLTYGTYHPTLALDRYDLALVFKAVISKLVETKIAKPAVPTAIVAPAADDGCLGDARFTSWQCIYGGGL